MDDNGKMSSTCIPAKTMQLSPPFLSTGAGCSRGLTLAILRQSLRCTATLLGLTLAGVGLQAKPACAAPPGSSSSAAVTTAKAAALPDAPQAQTPSWQGTHTFLGVQLGPAYPPEPGHWDTIVNPGQHPARLGAFGKLVYAGHEQIQPIVLFPGLLSAGYGQLADANPHFGIDAGGFGERFGAAMLRQASGRITGDGLFPALFHQDPRFYRQADGPIPQRGLHAVRQTFVRRNDDGKERFNYSGILGHAVANALTVTYYPHASANARVAAQGFGTSVAADMGTKLLFEFGPDLLRNTFHHNR